jgi:hypothetical protein
MARRRDGVDIGVQLHRPRLDREFDRGAASRGVAISFREYFAMGSPLTVLTIAIGMLWLWF